uniref:uncharacterized protein LOC120348331 n=1 Tax=Styela clava TaxID=7725 RepID=UPI00193A993E|nr:uncharacterized protein LOC120348331 [Styela clava]
MEKILIVCAFLAPLLMRGWCLQCYDCFNCTAVNANDTDIVTCDEVPPIQAPEWSAACEKFEGTLNGDYLVGRACSFALKETCIEQYIASPETNLTGESCYCRSDLCNGAESFSFNFLLTAAITSTLVSVFAY